MRKGSKTLSIAIKGQKTSSLKFVVTLLEHYPGEDSTPPAKKRKRNEQTNKQKRGTLRETVLPCSMVVKNVKTSNILVYKNPEILCVRYKFNPQRIIVFVLKLSSLDSY